MLPSHLQILGITMLINSSNCAHIHHCHHISLNTSSPSSDQLKEKFDRVCYLIRFFDTKHFNPLNFGAMSHTALVNELTELLEVFENFKDDANLTDKERLIATATYVTLALFVEKFYQMQHDLQLAYELDQDLESDPEQQLAIHFSNEVTQMIFENDKYITFLGLQLIHALFSLNLENAHQVQEVEKELQTLLQNLTQNFVYFIELDNTEIQSVETAQQLRDYFYTTALDLKSILDQFTHNLEINGESNENFSKLAQAYHVFQEQTLGIINCEEDSDLVLKMQKNAIPAYQALLNQIKVPG